MTCTKTCRMCGASCDCPGQEYHDLRERSCALDELMAVVTVFCEKGQTIDHVMDKCRRITRREAKP